MKPPFPQRRLVFHPFSRSFDNGRHRRRGLLPELELRGEGWTLIKPDVGQLGPGVIMVLEGLTQEEEALARSGLARGARLVLDAAAFLTGASEESAGRFAALCSLAERIVAPDEAARATLAIVAPIGKTAIVPDAVETFGALQRAAASVDRTLSLAADPAPCSAAILWCWSPEEGDQARALRDLIALKAAIGGLELLVVAPESARGPVQEAFPSVRLQPWSIETELEALSKAGLLVFPGEPGSATPLQRSRILRALDAGCLVLAPSGPGSRDISGALLRDKPEEGLKLYREGRFANFCSSSDFSGESSTGQTSWHDLLTSLYEAPPFGAAPVRLLLAMDLVQDLDLCEPILREALRRRDVVVEVVASSWLLSQSPRVARLLDELGVRYSVAERRELVEGREPSLDSVDAVLTPVATNLNAHKRAESVIQRARQAGVPTFSMQHGLENVGLTYFDDLFGTDVEISTDFLFAWFPEHVTPAVVPAHLRPRLAHVGSVKSRPTKAADLPPQARGSCVVSVFENLHWERYDDDFRRRFVQDLQAAARALPTNLFLVKPHHAGRWATPASFDRKPENLLILDPTDPAWEPYTAPALIAGSDVVITTPSTVALDAATAGVTPAVVAYGLDLPLFNPLPLLQSGEDWVPFIRTAASQRSREISLSAEVPLAAARKEFLARTLVPGPAGARVLDLIVEAARSVRP